MTTRGTTYRGVRTSAGSMVTVEPADGSRTILNPRLDLKNHSPTGFGWGYGGSRPAQLALALIADTGGNDETAVETYQDFKREVVAFLPREGFTLTAGGILKIVHRICRRRVGCRRSRSC